MKVRDTFLEFGGITMENNESYFYQNQGFKVGEISPDLNQESEEEMTEKKTKKKARSEETLAEKLARQTARYQHLNKEVRAVGRVALSSVTREQATLVIQYINAKEALEKTKEEVDQQAEEIAQLKAQVAELEKGQSQK